MDCYLAQILGLMTSLAGTDEEKKLQMSLLWTAHSQITLYVCFSASHSYVSASAADQEEITLRWFIKSRQVHSVVFWLFAQSCLLTSKRGRGLTCASRYITPLKATIPLTFEITGTWKRQCLYRFRVQNVQCFCIHIFIFLWLILLYEEGQGPLHTSLPILNT